MLWTFDAETTAPAFPIPFDERLPEIALRGWSRMLPSLERYFTRLPRMTVDGGYYVKTPENRPLVGPLPVAGAYVDAAWSGFGIMGACAGGELLAAHVRGAPLPAYARRSIQRGSTTPPISTRSLTPTGSSEPRTLPESTGSHASS